MGIQVGEPGQPELPNVCGVYLRQRTESLLIVSAAVGHPVRRLRICMGEPGCIYIRLRRAGGCRFDYNEYGYDSDARIGMESMQQ
jgi:hypothetical protein